MSVTRHKIIQWYHLQLNCDKCGSRMGESKFIPSFTNDWTKAHYEAKCPNCGNTMDTGNQIYPKTAYEFEGAGEVVED